MRRGSRIRLWTAFLVLACLAVAGCGAGGAKPRGQILVNGQPYKFADGEHMTVSFVPLEVGKGETTAADVDKDGSFKVESLSLSPATYRVLVTSSIGEAYIDPLRGAFSGSNSPLKVDIGSESAPSLKIDLGARTVTKA